MRKFLIIMLLIPNLAFADASELGPCPPIGEGAAVNETLPDEVRKFLDSRWACVHFAGEIGSGDAARERFLAQEARRNCKNQALKLEKIREKYKSNLTAMKFLNLLHPEPDFSDMDHMEEELCKTGIITTGGSTR